MRQLQSFLLQNLTSLQSIYTAVSMPVRQIHTRVQMPIYPGRDIGLFNCQPRKRKQRWQMFPFLEGIGSLDPLQAYLFCTQSNSTLASC